MKMTKNRKLILSMLDDNDGYDLPPFSASYINNRFSGIKQFGDGSQYCPNRSQVFRTLKDLWHGGLIVAERMKQEAFADRLSYWELQYQVSASVERNYIAKEANRLHRKTNSAKYGVKFFSEIPFDYGLPTEEVSKLKSDIKSLMQRCHPDKQPGYESEFNQLAQSIAIIRTGIPLPSDNVSTIEPELEMKRL